MPRVSFNLSQPRWNASAWQSSFSHSLKKSTWWNGWFPRSLRLRHHGLFHFPHSWGKEKRCTLSLHGQLCKPGLTDIPASPWAGAIWQLPDDAGRRLTRLVDAPLQRHSHWFYTKALYDSQIKTWRPSRRWRRQRDNGADCACNFQGREWLRTWAWLENIVRIYLVLLFLEGRWSPTKCFHTLLVNNHLAVRSERRSILETALNIQFQLGHNLNTPSEVTKKPKRNPSLQLVRWSWNWLV